MSVGTFQGGGRDGTTLFLHRHRGAWKILFCWRAVNPAPVEYAAGCGGGDGDAAAAGKTAHGGCIDAALVRLADTRAAYAEVAAPQDLFERHEKRRRGQEGLRPAGVDAHLLEVIVGRPVRDPPVLLPRACMTRQLRRSTQICAADIEERSADGVWFDNGGA